MLDDIQREVAIHLLANALRKCRITSERHGNNAGPAAHGGRRRNPEDEYLRGMVDLLTALHGRVLADQLQREARRFELNSPVEPKRLPQNHGDEFDA